MIEQIQNRTEKIVTLVLATMLLSVAVGSAVPVVAQSSTAIDDFEDGDLSEYGADASGSNPLETGSLSVSDDISTESIIAVLGAFVFLVLVGVAVRRVA